MKRITLLVTSFLMSCIDPFAVDNNLESRLLTVDALITTGDGSSQVRLTMSNNYNNSYEGTTLPLTGASVAVRDGLGQVVLFEEEIIPTVTYYDSFFRIWRTEVINRPTGIYKPPPTFKVQLDKSYTLLIETPDGKHYTSTPEKATPVANLESVNVRPHKFPSTNRLQFNSGLYFDVTFSDPKEQEDYYMWRTSNAWGVLVTFPEFYKDGHCLPTQLSCFRPKECCKRCFLPETRLDGTFAIHNDQLFDGLSTTMPIFFVPDDGFRFMERYRIQIDQHAISEEAFRFLKLVKQQLEIEGSVFDPPPANIRGNMINLDNPQEQVLGYFFVTDVSSQMVYINRSDIPGEFLQPTAVVEDDCREFFGFTGSFLRTGRLNTVPPVDWEYE